MTKQFFISVGLFSIFTLPSFLWAQSRCAQIHRNSGSYLTQNWNGAPAFERFNGSLSKEMLSRYQLSVGADGESLFGLIEGKSALIGTLKTLHAKYLFEWSDNALADFVTKNKGITREHLDYVLKAPGQVAGKGFYISLDPLDSTSFGDRISVFRPSKPLVVLEYTLDQTNNFKNDTDFVKKIGLAGVDGIRYKGYSSKWLSMIHERTLQNIVQTPPDILPAYLVDPSSIFNAMMALHKFSPSAWEKVPDSNPGKKFANKVPLTLEDYIYLSPAFGKMAGYHHPIIPGLLETGLRVQSRADFIQILRLINQVSARISSLVKLDPKATARERSYEAILEIYDFKTVAMIDTAMEKDSISLKEMKSGATKYLAGKNNLKLKDIRNLSDFSKAAESLFGGTYQIRDSNVHMGEVSKISEGTIEVTPAAREVLIQNPFLEIAASKVKSQESSRIRIFAEYWNLKNKKVQVRKCLSDKLNSEMDAWLAENPGKDFTESADPTVRKFTRQVLTELLTLLIENPKVFFKNLFNKSEFEVTALDRYNAFMSLHPFKDGNGRAGRLFYEVTSTHNLSLDLSDRSLNLPIYDLDLFSTPEQISRYTNLGSFLKAWARQAKTDQEFVLRSKWALDMLFEVEPGMIKAD